MSEVGLARVASRAATFHAEEGRVLALEGDPGAGMFILCEGTIAV
jgi:ABC-type Na+ transport system ATPase subunit NatA